MRCSLYFYFLEQIVENWYNLFLKRLLESSSEVIGPGALGFGRLEIIDLISLIRMGHSDCLSVLRTSW